MRAGENELARDQFIVLILLNARRRPYGTW